MLCPYQSRKNAKPTSFRKQPGLRSMKNFEKKSQDKSTETVYKVLALDDFIFILRIQGTDY